MIDISSETDDFGGLIDFFTALDEPWGIKNSESRHIFMNHAARLYTNTPFDFDIEGKLDAEFPAEWSELANDLIEHDRLTQKKSHRVAVIETHYWNGSRLIYPYLSEKIPVFNRHKEVIGTVWNAKKLNTSSPLKYISKQKPTVLNTEPPIDIFTKSELVVAFFALQRYSSKEISKKLNLSTKTIENRLNGMYQKTGTHSLTQFSEYCNSHGLDNYVPYELMIKGIQFL